MDSETKVKRFQKITVGFVVQNFERDKNGVPHCIEQDFICGAKVTFEDNTTNPGEYIEPQTDAYQPFNMRI